MKTLDVKFNGKAYKIRNNQLTRRFWAEEVAANQDMMGIESVVRYAYCLLKGFNLSFTMPYLEFEMYIDDEQNTDFIKAATELISDLMDESKSLSKEGDGEDTGKKVDGRTLIWDYYKICVGHCKIDPHYFWYDIEPEEIDNIIKAYVDRYRDKWERTRLISYYAASGMSKLPTVRKFMPFAWDDEKEQKQHRPNQTKRKPSKEMMKLIADNNKIQK